MSTPTDGATEHPNAPTLVGGRVAVAVAALAGLVVGWGVGAPLAAAVAAVAGLLFGPAASDLERGGTRVTVRGGLFGLLGVALLAGSAGWTGGVAGLVVAGVGVAVTTCAIDAAVGFDTDATGSLTRMFWWSGSALTLGTLALAAVTTGTVVLAVQAAGAGLQWTLWLNDTAALLVLQVLALAFGVAVHAALPVVERYAPRSVVDGTAPLSAVAVDPRSLPRGVWVVLGLEAVAAAYAPGLLSWVLAVVPVVGEVVRLLLRSGVLHVPILVGALAATAVAVSAPIGRSLRSVLGQDPAETLALAGAGVVTTLLVGVPLAIPPAARAVVARLPAGQLRTSADLFGPAVVALGGLTIAVVCVTMAFGVVLFASAFPGVPRRARGFAVGAGSLFAVALGAGALGVGPVVTVLGVAGAVLVWDAGSHATELGLSVGRAGETRSAELVHLTGSTLVAGAGVAVALIAVYLLGPVGGFAGVGDRRAMLALTLTLVSLVATVWLLD